MFHQSLRSETKYSSPDGDHSGWRTDSCTPPATFRDEVMLPSRSSSPTQISLPSQGMLGWFQVCQARRAPSGLSFGEE